MDNVIVNGVAWKLDQSDVTLIVENLINLMPGLHLQLNRRKSRASPPTQPSLICGCVAGGARL